MPEGSSIIDGVTSGEEIEETQDSETGDQGGDAGSQGSDDQGGQGNSDDSKLKSKDGGKGEQQLTEKGTKLDPDPMSALNQTLANERRFRLQYEKLLNDPDQLVEYAATMGLKLTKEQAKEVQKDKTIDPDKIETVEDLRAFAKQLQTQVATKAGELDKGIQGLRQNSKDESITNQFKTDMDDARSKYPELDPRSESYNKDLDETIGRLFLAADVDPNTRKLAGRVRLSTFVDQVMSVRKNGQETGSRDAQTVVKDKRRGQVRTGSQGDGTPDESNMTPSQIIASRMKRMTGGR